jgi:thymidylate synthase
MAFEEFWFFLNGKTQTKELEEKGINFWKGNTSKEFLSKRGLGHLDEGDLGVAYGSQLRAYGQSTIFGVEGKDQLVDTYETLKNDKYSRRVYNTMWNPNESHLMALTPCWHSHQFVVLPDEDGNDVLHLKLFSRSADTVFGAMYAIQQYRLYQMCMAKLLGFNVGKLSCDLTQIHIYLNQIEYAEEILTRSFGFDVDAYDINRISIDKDLNTLDDLLTLQWSDFGINHPTVNKEPFVTPRPPMAA